MTFPLHRSRPVLIAAASALLFVSCADSPTELRPTPTADPTSGHQSIVHAQRTFHQDGIKVTVENGIARFADGRVIRLPNPLAEALALGDGARADSRIYDSVTFGDGELLAQVRHSYEQAGPVSSDRLAAFESLARRETEAHLAKGPNASRYVPSLGMLGGISGSAALNECGTSYQSVRDIAATQANGHRMMDLLCGEDDLSETCLDLARGIYGTTQRLNGYWDDFFANQWEDFFQNVISGDLKDAAEDLTTEVLLAYVEYEYLQILRDIMVFFFNGYDCYHNM